MTTFVVAYGRLVVRDQPIPALTFGQHGTPAVLPKLRGQRYCHIWEAHRLVLHARLDTGYLMLKADTRQMLTEALEVECVEAAPDRRAVAHLRHGHPALLDVAVD